MERTRYLSLVSVFIAILTVALTMLVFIRNLNVEQIIRELGLPTFIVIVFVQIVLIAAIFSILSKRILF